MFWRCARSRWCRSSQRSRRVALMGRSATATQTDVPTPVTRGLYTCCAVRLYVEYAPVRSVTAGRRSRQTDGLHAPRRAATRSAFYKSTTRLKNGGGCVEAAPTLSATLFRCARCGARAMGPQLRASSVGGDKGPPCPSEKSCGMPGGARDRAVQEARCTSGWDMIVEFASIA